MDNQLTEYNRSLTTIKSEGDLPPHITFEQYKTLRNHHEITETKDKIFITLLWETGGRVSDVLSFRWKNFEGLNSSMPNLRFVIQKTQKPINIPISGDMASDLRQWKGLVNPESDNDFLFPGDGSLGHETRQNVQKKMKVWGKLINIPDYIRKKTGKEVNGLHAHLFRHGLIVYLFLVQGLHYKVIAARTGHSNPMMIINTYSVVTTEMQRAALKDIPLR